MRLFIVFLLGSILLGPLAAGLIIGVTALGISLIRTIQDFRGKSLMNPKDTSWLDRATLEKELWDHDRAKHDKDEKAAS